MYEIGSGLLLLHKIVFPHQVAHGCSMKSQVTGDFTYTGREYDSESGLRKRGQISV